MKVYIAKRKSDGAVWCGRKQVYEKIGGLKSAMKLSWGGQKVDEYDIHCYELKDGEIVK